MVASLRFACSPDGALLAVSRYRHIAIVCTATGQTAIAISHLDINGRPVAFVHNSRYVASHGLFDWRQNTTRFFVFRVADGAQVFARTVSGEVQLKAVGNRMAYRSDSGELVVLEMIEDEVQEVCRRRGVSCFALGNNGSILVVDKRNTMVRIDQGGREWIVPTAPWPHPLFDVELAGDRLVSVDRTGRVDLVDLQTGRRTAVTAFGKPAEDVPFAVGSDFIVSGETPGRITVTNLRAGTALQGDVQPMQRVEMAWVLMAFSVSFLLWSLCLLRDGRRSGHRWRTWIDIALLIALMHVMWIGNPSVYMDHYYTRSFGLVMFFIAIWGTVGSVLTFGAVMNPRYEWAPWTAIVVASVIPTLAPVAGMGLLLRWLRWRVGHVDSFGPKADCESAFRPPRPSARAGRQYSIRQLFFATTACAAALAVARHLLVGNDEFLSAGFWFALLLLIGLLAAVTVWSSRMVLVASLVLMGVGCAGFSIVDQILGDFTTLTLAVSNTCFLCSHLRLSGYVMRRIPRAAVLQNRSLWGQLSARHVGDEDADVRP
jgi:hypothetical protein